MLTQPKVETKMGAIIEPINEDALLKTKPQNRYKKKTKQKQELGSKIPV